MSFWDLMADVAAEGLKAVPGGGIASGIAKGLGGSGGRRRRPRRRGIPRKVMSDVAQVKGLLGPKSAETVLLTLLNKG